MNRQDLRTSPRRRRLGTVTKRDKWIVASLVPLVLANLAMAAPQNPWDEYLVLAAQNNPKLQADFNRYLAALQKVPQMASLPDPTATFAFFIEPMERYAGDQIGSIGVMQMFPWFGTLDAARQEAAAMAKAEFHTFREAKHALFFEVKSSLLELYVLEQEIKAARQNVETLKSLERIALIRFGGGGSSGGMGEGGSARQSMSGSGAGKARSDGQSSAGSMGGMAGMGGEGNSGITSSDPAGGKIGSMETMPSGDGGGSGMVDVLRAQMEVKEWESRLLSLQDDRWTLIARCNRLMGRSLNDSISLPDSLNALPWPVGLAEGIAKQNPMLSMLEAEEKAFAQRERMNRKMGWPMLGFGLQYDLFRAREGGAHGAEGGEGHNMLMPMVSLSLPIWRGKTGAAVKEAALQRKAVASRKQDAVAGFKVEEMEIQRDFQDAARRMDLYQAQKNLARQALRIQTAQYSATGQGFEDLLRLQNQALEYALLWERAVADNHVAVARAERITGTEPHGAENPEHRERSF